MSLQGINRFLNLRMTWHSDPNDALAVVPFSVLVGQFRILKQSNKNTQDKLWFYPNLLQMSAGYTLPFTRTRKLRPNTITENELG